MEKKEFQKLFRNNMKALGFRTNGNYSFKFVDDNYLIGVYLDHHPYVKGYFVEYGVIYEPDEKRLPFRGFVDWKGSFWFTTNPDDDLSKYAIEDFKRRDDRSVLIDWFEYDCRTAEDFDRAFAINVEKCLIRLYDRNFILDLFKNDWTYFACAYKPTAKKLIKILGLNEEEVFRECENIRMRNRPKLF